MTTLNLKVGNEILEEYVIFTEIWGMSDVLKYDLIL